MNKICRKCGFSGEDILFVKRENKCKNCQKEDNKQYKAQHTKDRSEYYKQYYQENKEKILSQQDQYYQENKEKIMLRQKQYEMLHNEILEYRERYRKDHKDDYRKYYLANKDKLSKYHNEYMKKRNKSDPAFRLRGNCSKLINYALKGKKIGKSILQYLPYSMEELKIHLEKQFDENMNWGNYGSYWQIDHVYPQSKLPYTSMEDDNFKKCWSLNNLRPLEKIMNIRKGNKVINNIVRSL